MAAIVGERVSPGDAIVDYEDKVFPDHQAEPGQKAFVFYHVCRSRARPHWSTC